MHLKFFSLAPFWFVLAATLPAMPATAPERLEVEIMIYSGRPNPTFTITDMAEIREILGAAKAFPRAPSAAAAPSHPKLGYRGIVVANRSSVSVDLERFTVERSTVLLTGAARASSVPGVAAATSATEARFDGSAALEQRLLAIAEGRGVLAPAALAHIRSRR